jgi:nucleolar protein 4
MNFLQASEGTITDGTRAWEAMSSADRQLRQRCADEKGTKLKNPNFFVSTTRLRVRNIPATMDQKAIKQMFLDAVNPGALSPWFVCQEE